MSSPTPKRLTVVGACNIRTKHLAGELNGWGRRRVNASHADNFQSPCIKYLRIDDRDRRFFNSSLPLYSAMLPLVEALMSTTATKDNHRSLKSSSVAGVNRRTSRKRVRCRLGVPEQLTLLPCFVPCAHQRGISCSVVMSPTHKQPKGDAIQSMMFGE